MVTKQSNLCVNPFLPEMFVQYIEVDFTCLLPCRYYSDGVILTHMYLSIHLIHSAN